MGVAQERESRDQGIGIDGVRGKGSVLGVCGFEGCRVSGSGFGAGMVGSGMRTQAWGYSQSQLTEVLFSRHTDSG